MRPRTICEVTSMPEILTPDGQPDRSWLSKAMAMRRVLVDHCRRKRAQAQSSGRHGLDLVALDKALDALAESDARMADYFTLRFFGDCSNDEAARVLSISSRS